jgi:SusD/RagB-like outer membrane lipoprotein
MRYKILSVFAALAAITACGDLTSINQNPNGPVDVPPPSILGNVIQNVVGGVNGVNSLNIRGGGLWVQYYSEIQYRDEDKYIVRSGTSGGWGFYNGSLEDLQRMIVKGEANSTPNWSAVGRVLKSYTFSVMTDAMGDIPYSQALRGDTVLAPAYDTQQSIYNDLFVQLAQANSDFDLAPGAVGFSSGDLIYGGDMAAWKKFGNSLRLRLAVHLSNVDPTKAATEAAAAVAAGVFTDNADNATLLYLGTSPNRNPIFNDAQGRDDYGMSKTFVDSLTSWADPRLPVFAQRNPANTGIQGLPNGLNDGEGTPIVNISRFGAYWRSTPGAPMDLLTYSEVLFLEAEAAERGWIPGGTAAAATYYTNAITASMQQFGVVPGDITTYLAQAKVGYDAAGATLAGHLQQIAYQKWTSQFMQGMEAWTEFRRTQIPSLLPGPRVVAPFVAGLANNIPERLPYDDNEAVLNGANLSAAVAAQGFSQGNDITKALWFTGRQ